MRIGGLRGQDGSASLELALITPALLVVLLFVVGLGRLGGARMDVDGAAAQAARAASVARTSAAARSAATDAASAALGDRSLRCASLDVAVDTTAFRPGGQVVVDLTCTVSLSSLSGFSLPGAKTLRGRAVAVVDAFTSSG
jgi:Flp pilus assembly protein TadG